MKKYQKKIMEFIKYQLDVLHRTVNRLDLSEVEDADILHTVNSNLLILVGMMNDKKKKAWSRRKLVKEVKPPEQKIVHTGTPIGAMVSKSPALQPPVEGEPHYQMYGILPSGHSVEIQPHIAIKDANFYKVVIKPAQGVVGSTMGPLLDFLFANHQNLLKDNPDNHRILGEGDDAKAAILEAVENGQPIEMTVGVDEKPYVPSQRQAEDLRGYLADVKESKLPDHLM